MAFVRFGVDGSQVYIYEETGDTKVCCMCAFTERRPETGRWDPDFRTADLDAMLAHLAEHRAAGHVVPAWVDKNLRDEWDESDDHAESAISPQNTRQRPATTNATQRS